MKGTRPITVDEIEQIKVYFSQIIGHEVIDKRDLETRNYTLFMFSLYTGLRISEILSLKAKDVVQYEKIAETAYLQKENTKGKKEGRVITLNENCRDLLDDYFKHYGYYEILKLTPNLCLWPSRQGQGLGVRQAGYIFQKIFQENKMEGKLATHTGRKTFAKFAFEGLGCDILALKSAMGHSSITATMCYVNPNADKVKKMLAEMKY